MVRAAAKNHAHVGVLVDPADYELVLGELRSAGVARAPRPGAGWPARPSPTPRPTTPPSSRGSTTPTRPAGPCSRPRSTRPWSWPSRCATARTPTSRGARYRRIGARSWWDGAVQHGGKELSYLNLFDAEAAWRLVHRLGEQPAAVVIKHANPCGAAVAGDITTAYQRAHAGDPVSAFGGIVAVNRPVPRALAEALAPVFTEVVVAPGFDDDALALLTAKKNLRVLDGAVARGRDARSAHHRRRRCWCRRSTRSASIAPRWRVVTKVAPDRGAVGRPRAGVAGVRRGQLERHRAGAGRPGGRDRGRAAEPARLGAHRGGEGRRAGRRRSVCQRRLLPVPGRRRRASPRRGRRGDPAGRLASATRRPSPPPTSTAWPWSSPASATSATDACAPTAPPRLGHPARLGPARPPGPAPAMSHGSLPLLQRSVTQWPVRRRRRFGTDSVASRPGDVGGHGGSWQVTAGAAGGGDGGRRTE